MGILCNTMASSVNFGPKLIVLEYHGMFFFKYRCVIYKWTSWWFYFEHRPCGRSLTHERHACRVQSVAAQSTEQHNHSVIACVSAHLSILSIYTIYAQVHSTLNVVQIIVPSTWPPARQESVHCALVVLRNSGVRHYVACLILHQNPLPNECNTEVLYLTHMPVQH